MPHTTRLSQTARRTRLRRGAAGIAAAALALPLTVVAIAPAAAAAHVRPVDRGWYGGPPSPYDAPFGQAYGAPYGWGSDLGWAGATGTTSALDTTEASAEQSAGVVLVDSTLADGSAAGTGLVLAADGLVVTNHHVVEGATEVEVTVPATGESYAAEVLGSDAARDVAVLRLEDASGLAVVDTDITRLVPGAAVTAVGDAGGDGGSLTAAAGTVTAVGADITVSDEAGGSSRLWNLVEVDADIVPGDSGGALLDEDGEVVGMNVAASSGAADITGYAIPVARVLRVADAVVATQAG